MKRLFSFVLVVFILVFSVLPCYALTEEELTLLEKSRAYDSNIKYDNEVFLSKLNYSKSGTSRSSSSSIVVDSAYFNFTNLSSYNLSSSYFLTGFYDYINLYVNQSNYKIYFVPCEIYSSGRFEYGFIVIGSDKSINIVDTQTVGSSNYNHHSGYTLANFYLDDNSTVTYSILAGLHNRASGYVNNNWTYTLPDSTSYQVNFTVFDSSYFLLFDNGHCVSSAFCSEDYLYVDSGESSGEDYSGFLNTIITEIRKIPTKLTDAITEIRNLPTIILNGIRAIFIPDTEQMQQDFDDFVDYLELKLGYAPLIDTLRSMVSVQNGSNISVASADIQENVTFSFNGVSVPVQVSLPFSSVFSSTAKGYMTDLLKGFFFVLLLFYNLSEIYFLIRGSRPFKDSRSSVSTGNNTPLFELDSSSGMFVPGRSDWEKRHIH